MMKRLVMVMMALWPAMVLAQPTGNVYHRLVVEDEYGELSVSSFYVYLPGTTTEATIYQDRSQTLALAQPITPTSTNTTLLGGRLYWWGPDGFDYKVTAGSLTQDNAETDSLDASTGFIHMQHAISLDSELYALAHMDPNAGDVPYFPTTSTASSFPTTSWSRAMMARASEALWKAYVNLEIGTDVQASDPNLTLLAAADPNAGDVFYWPTSTTGSSFLTTPWTRAMMAPVSEALWKAYVNLEANTDFYAPAGTDVAVTDGGTGASTAAAARSNLSAQKQYMIDVTEAPYNADNTGATDATTALQAAITATPQGGTLFFPAGVYKITPPLRVGQWSINDQNDVLGWSGGNNGIKIVGGGDFASSPSVYIIATGTAQSGNSSTTYTDSVGTYDIITNNHAVFEVVNCRGVEFDGLCIDGNDVAFAGIWNDGPSANMIVRRTKIYDCIGPGLRVGTLWDSVGNAVYYGYGNSPYFKANVFNVTTYGGWANDALTVESCEFISDGIGATCESGQGINQVFRNCKLTSNTSYNFLNYNARTTFDNCHFIGSTAYNVLSPSTGGYLRFNNCHDEATCSQQFLATGNGNGAGPVLVFDDSEVNDDIFTSCGARISVINGSEIDGGIYRLVDYDQDWFCDVRNSSIDLISLCTSSYDTRILITGSNIDVTGGGALLQGVGAAENVRWITNVYPATAYTYTNVLSKLQLTTSLLVGTSSIGTALFLAGDTSVGGTVIGGIQNDDNTNSASHARWKIATGGTSAGDPILQLTNGTGNWYFNLDNDDSDKLKIGTTQSDNNLVGTSGGRWGIGTADPNESLDVDGNVQTEQVIADSILFTDEDASPDANGMLKYDNTVAGFTDGLLEWYDDDAVRYIVDLDTLPGDTEDDKVVAYDKDADKFYMKADAGSGAAGTVTTVNAGGVQVGDADIVTLDFNDIPFIVTENPDTTINIDVNETWLATFAASDPNSHDAVTLDPNMAAIFTLDGQAIEVNIATPTNGRDDALPTSDDVYDFVTGLGYITADPNSHDAVTVTQSPSVTLTLTGQDVQADVNETYTDTLYLGLMDDANGVIADGVALGDDTTGNYVASITNGTSITGGDGGSEGAALTLDVADDSIDGTELADTITLDATTQIATGTYTLQVQVNNTAVHGFEINGTGAFTGDLLHVHQHTGNPTSGSLAVFEWEDPDVNGVIINANAAGAGAVTGLLITTDDDDSSNYTPFEVRDDSGANNDLLFDIDYTGKATAAGGFAGALTGNVTGNADTATTASNLAEDGVDAITEIAAALKSGSDTTLITGTAGTTDYYAKWNADGDLVDGTNADGIAGSISEGALTNSSIVSADIKDGEVGAGDLAATLDLSSKTITAPPKLSGLIDRWMFCIADPNYYYSSVQHYLIIDPNTSYDLTVDKAQVTLDDDPTTEIEMDLCFADNRDDLADPNVIGVLDTTAGAANVTSFSDATVPANKVVYIVINTQPDADTKTANYKIDWHYD